MHTLFLSKLYALAGICGSLLLGTAAAAAAEQPNIVIIMADDLGYGDVSYAGSSRIPTPSIDRMAAEGRRFTSGYCSSSTCTPSRFAMLTGTHAFRVPGTGIAAPNSPALIKPGTETLATLLKRAGYATAVIGKWHLGLGQTKPAWNAELKPGPLEIGFDHCLLLPTTNDRVPQVFVEDHRVRNLDPKDPLWVGEEKPAEDHPTGVTHRATLRMDWEHGHNGTIHNGISRIGFYTGGMKARFRDEDLADEWLNESKKWIASVKAKPFFLYFASHDIHVPRMPHERFQGKSGMGPRGDSLLEFDWSVGELLKFLDAEKLSKNTLVFLVSDNGPVLGDGYKDDAAEKNGEHKSGGPLTGGKYSVHEGGTRTPFLAWWPGRITPGSSDEIVSSVDFFASFAALTGQQMAKDVARDSFNLLPVFLGERDAAGRDHMIQQDNNGNKMGLRMREWKLIRTPNGKNKEPKFELFNLASDLAETQNLSKEHPKQLEEMKVMLAQYLSAEGTRPQK